MSSGDVGSRGWRLGEGGSLYTTLAPVDLGRGVWLWICREKERWCMEAALAGLFKEAAGAETDVKEKKAEFTDFAVAAVLSFYMLGSLSEGAESW